MLAASAICVLRCAGYNGRIMTSNPAAGAAAAPILQPYVSPREAPAIWFLGSLTFVKASRDTTGGAFGLVEQLLPAGFASPYHVHHAEDESFYVIEGEATFIVD